jgi:hypothetical protein
METNNQIVKPKLGNLKKAIIYITLLISVIFIFVSTTKKKTNNGFSSALYTGESKTSVKNPLPEKLKWSDSFKGINNMGK